MDFQVLSALLYTSNVPNEASVPNDYEEEPHAIMSHEIIYVGSSENTPIQVSNVPIIPFARDTVALITQNAPIIHNVPNVANYNIPIIPNVANYNMPIIPKITPNMPNAPDIPIIPDITSNTPNAPNMPNTPDIPNVPIMPNTTGMPCAPISHNMPNSTHSVTSTPSYIERQPSSAQSERPISWNKNEDDASEDSRILKGSKNMLKKFFNIFKGVAQEKVEDQNITNDVVSPLIKPSIKAFADFEEYKNSQVVNKTFSDIENKQSNSDILINQIEEYKKQLNKNYFVISVKYDRICYKYNAISLAIMILSALSTFVEALRLTLTEYMKNNIDTILIDIGTFTLTINVLMLITGTVVTILSSIIRFKNYREIMEKLKNIQNMIVKYIMLYNKQIDLIHTYSIKDNMDDDVYADFSAKIKEYNKEINDNINIMEDIRNNDMIKLQKYKHSFDIQLEKMQTEKELKLIELKNKKDIEMALLNNLKDVELFKLDNHKNKSLKELDYIKEEYEKHKFVEVTRLNNKINLDLEKLKVNFDNKVKEIYHIFTNKQSTTPSTTAMSATHVTSNIYDHNVSIV